MLSNVQNTLKSYADEFNKMMKEYREKQEYIHKMYSEECAIDLDKKAAEEKNELEIKAQEKAITEINEIFDSAKEQITENAGENVDANFTEEYKVLKDVPLSVDEFEMLVDKYKGNYMSVKLLNALAEKNHIPFFVIPFTEKLEALDTLKAKCIDFIRTYPGENQSYNHELLLRGNLIKPVEDFVKSHVKENGTADKD